MEWRRAPTTPIVGPGLGLAVETAAIETLTGVYKEDDQNREQPGLLTQVVDSPKRFACRRLVALGSGRTGLLTVNRQTNDPISTVVHILSVFCERGITGNYPCIRAPTREASVTITTQLITQRVPGVVVDRIDHTGRRRRVSAAFGAPMPQSLLLDVSAELDRDAVSEDRWPISSRVVTREMPRAGRPGFRNMDCMTCRSTSQTE